jgi:hypothetical protein
MLLLRGYKSIRYPNQGINSLIHQCLLFQQIGFVFQGEYSRLVSLGNFTAITLKQPLEGGLALSQRLRYLAPTRSLETSFMQG